MPLTSKPGRKPRCRQCRRQVIAVSLKKRCAACAATNQLDNIVAMRNKRGASYDKWLKGMKRAVAISENGNMGKDKDTN